MQFSFAGKKVSFPFRLKTEQKAKGPRNSVTTAASTPCRKNSSKQRMVVLKQVLVASSILLLRHQSVQLFSSG
jgi:hypothetical protein